MSGRAVVIGDVVVGFSSSSSKAGVEFTDGEAKVLFSALNGHGTLGSTDGGRLLGLEERCA